MDQGGRGDAWGPRIAAQVVLAGTVEGLEFESRGFRVLWVQTLVTAETTMGVKCDGTNCIKVVSAFVRPAMQHKPNS